LERLTADSIQRDLKNRHGQSQKSLPAKIFTARQKAIAACPTQTWKKSMDWFVARTPTAPQLYFIVATPSEHLGSIHRLRSLRRRLPRPWTEDAQEEAAGPKSKLSTGFHSRFSNHSTLPPRRVTGQGY